MYVGKERSAGLGVWAQIFTQIKKGRGREEKDIYRERNIEKCGKILAFGEFGCRVNIDSLFCNFFCTSEMIFK